MSYYKLKSGEKLYYEDSGSGENTVVMLHGWTSSHEIYAEAVKYLKDTARCITYDHRGHGKSKSANKTHATMETLAQDLNELIEGLKLKNITLVGWSMGAGTVLSYVKLFGCKGLRQIVLCDMTPKQINDDGWKLGLYQGDYTEQDRQTDESKRPFIQYKKFILATAPYLKELPNLLLYRLLLKRLLKCDIPVITSLANSMKDLDNRDVIKKITVPLRYFYPTPGSLFSPKLEEWYRNNAVSDFKSVEFKDSTHLLVVEYPRFFATEIEKLLK